VILIFGWLDSLATYIVTNVFNLEITTNLGSSLHFFIYDAVKILILLSAMVFTISYIRSYIQPEKAKKVLEKYSGISGNFIAALFGVFSPFCSCSSIPLFIGFIEAGVPLGITFSFLITSPIVNEAAFIVLLSTFGWKIALIYAVFGILIGVIGGIIIGKMKMEKYVESYVYETRVQRRRKSRETTQKDRLSFAADFTLGILKKVGPFLIIGIGLGALIHGFVPEDLLIKYTGPQNPFAVIAATLIAIPLYFDALGTIPVAEALIEKGVGIGTALSFMMATTALSLPEAILLKKVIKTKLIATFFAITGISIIITGYIFNLIL